MHLQQHYKSNLALIDPSVIAFFALPTYKQIFKFFNIFSKI